MFDYALTPNQIYASMLEQGWTLHYFKATDLTWVRCEEENGHWIKHTVCKMKMALLKSGWLYITLNG